MLKSTSLILTALSGLALTITAQQPGDLDPTFGTGGKVITQFGGLLESSYGNSIAVYPGGDFVVAGDHATYDPTDTIDPYDQDIVVVRYDKDGALDNTFGSNGIVTMDLGMGYESINSVALQADGKIMLAGYAGIYPNYDFLLVRLNPDGTPDNSFGQNGIVIPPSSGILL